MNYGLTRHSYWFIITNKGVRGVTGFYRRKRDLSMGMSRVYFADLRATYKKTLLDKVVDLLDIMDLGGMIQPQGLVAVKLHFGERGNTAFIRPNFIRQIVDYVKTRGGVPFLTDTNTLYAGTRGNSVSHIKTALENGFAYTVVNAPVIIADGLRGGSYKEVRIDKEIFSRAFLAKEIYESDTLISVAHFKGHDVAGFGGTIKNLGMGCSSKKGKLEQHSGLSPKVKRKRCTGCGECIDFCAHDAIYMKDQKAVIDKEKCAGCGECVVMCPNRAINIRWNTDSPLFQKKMVEYAYAVVQGKKGRSAFMNFLIRISPACDCHPFNDAPVVRDLGILASTDPVAIDQASVDMINRQKTLDGSCVEHHREGGDDIFREIYPEIDWTIQLDYGQEIGLGSRDYELVKM